MSLGLPRFEIQPIHSYSEIVERIISVHVDAFLEMAVQERQILMVAGLAVIGRGTNALLWPKPACDHL